MSTIQITPQGGFAPAREFSYTGYDLDNSTAHNADVAPGSILQLAAGSTLAANALGAGWPTTGYNTPFCVLDEDIMSHDLTRMNNQAGITSNLRDGGPFKGITEGYVRARVKASVTKGITLLVPQPNQDYLVPFLASGLFSESVAAGTALSNTVSTEQSYAGAGNSVVIPANSLKVGDVIRGQLQIVVSAAASTDTHTVKVKIGSNIVAVTGVPDSVTGDVVVIHYTIVVRTIGASGTAISFSLSFQGTTGSAAGAADIPTGSALASFTLDTTAATTIQVTSTWSATTATCTSNIEAHNVYIDRLDTSLGNRPFAVAMETVDNSAAAALTKILILQPGLF